MPSQPSASCTPARTSNHAGLQGLLGAVAAGRLIPGSRVAHDKAKRQRRSLALLTSMGTDWRDNDPEVEPIVEIYQGDRMSYEREGAPRAGYDPQTSKFPSNAGGWYPKGFINLALQKGYRLGFQASSDHFSTHISYCIVLAERPDRAAMLDGLKKRHCYAATDDIILDVRSGGHVMGDEFPAAEAPALQIRVIGTGPLAKVEVLKDNEVVRTFQPGQAEFQGRWTDPKPTQGLHYYYVRVQQGDGELAWGSPMWIDHAR